MKVNYQIDCKCCGTSTEYSVDMGSSSMSVERVVHIDTECAMRCPSCRSRLNNTEADFRAQVKMTRIA